MFSKLIKSAFSAFLFLFLTLFFCVSISQASQPLKVAVTIGPYANFVKIVGKEYVDVHVLVPPGADPELYEPAAQTFVQLSKTKLYFMSGLLPFEKTMAPRLKSINKNLEIVDLSKFVKLNDGDPHIWISPPMVIVQVQTIEKTLSKLDPAHQKKYQTNASAFIKELQNLDKTFKTQLEKKKNRTFLTMHPSFGYLAQDYGLTQLALEHEGKSPHPKYIQTVIQKAKKDKIHYLLRQKEISPTTAKSFAGPLKLKIVEVDPLSPHYLENTKEFFKLLLNEFSQNVP